MSIIKQNSNGFLLSHHSIRFSIRFESKETEYIINPSYFAIHQPYKHKKKDSTVSKKYAESSELLEIQKKYLEMLTLIEDNVFFENKGNNPGAKELADIFYNDSAKRKLNNLKGGNDSDNGLIAEINNDQYLIPKHCEFHNRDVSEILSHLTTKYDVIVLDPPWWNKYIRRKRAFNADIAYNMMRNETLAELPVKRLLEDRGLVVVWCTNAESHMNALFDSIFPAWNVNHIATWFWLKVTTKGEPVTPFSPVGGKQPYEKIIFAVRDGMRKLPVPENGKLVVSVPSAIHSQKPPLSELLKPFLPSAPRCLEVFARSLMPHWTSYGNEVLKLQHISLFLEDCTRSEKPLPGDITSIR